MKYSIKYFSLSIIILLIVAACDTDKKDWEEAQKVNAIDGYEKFLSKHPDSSYSQEALSQIEEINREQTWKANTIEAYENFLQQYPESQHANVAKARIVFLNYKKAESIDTIDAYNHFLQQYPESQYASQARERIIELKYEEVESINTIEAYENFLQQYPESQYASQARERIIELKYEEVESVNTMEAYENFLQQYPESQCANWARERIVFLNYKKAESIDTVEAYNHFLEKYPTGNYANLVQKKLIELKASFAFEKAKSINTIEAYRIFLQQYRMSKYADSADKKLRELYLPIDFEEAKATNTIDGYKVFIEHHPDSPLTNEIYSLLEKLLYQEAVSQDTISSYENYLESFSSGYRSQKILNRMESKLYEKALAENTISSYENYLHYFSTGYNSKNIQNRLEELLQQVKHSEIQIEAIITNEKDKMEYNNDKFSDIFNVDLKFFGLYSVPSFFFVIGSNDFCFVIGSNDFYLFQADDYLSQAKKSEEYLLSTIQNRRIVPSVVCYYIKANQVLLTHLSNSLGSLYHQKKWLDKVSKDLESGVDPTLEETIIGSYNATLGIFNAQVDNFDTYMDLFYERIQAFSSLLAVTNYSSEDMKKVSVTIPINGKIATIPALEIALSLVASGKMRIGSILLESIGQIKIAYLNLLLNQFNNGDDAKQEIKILLKDLHDYYEFINRVTHGSGDKICEELKEALLLYRGSKGVFDDDILVKLEYYNEAETFVDIVRVQSWLMSEWEWE